MTDTVRVPRGAVEAIADDLRAISLELTKKRATTPVSEDIFRKALALEAMLAASPQGGGSSGEWITHDDGPNPVPGKMVEAQIESLIREHCYGNVDGEVVGVERAAAFIVDRIFTEGVRP